MWKAILLSIIYWVSAEVLKFSVCLAICCVNQIFSKVSNQTAGESEWGKVITAFWEFYSCSSSVYFNNFCCTLWEAPAFGSHHKKMFFFLFAFLLQETHTELLGSSSQMHICVNKRTKSLKRTRNNMIDSISVSPLIQCGLLQPL